MKRLFKKCVVVCSILLAVFSASPFIATPLFAQTPSNQTQAKPCSVSGDCFCGSNAGQKCTWNDFKIVIKNVLVYLVVPIALLYMFFRLGTTLLALVKGKAENNPQALATAYGDLKDILIGFGLVMLVAGGFLFGILKGVGVKTEFINILSNAFVSTAYAAGTQLVNPVVQGTLYDFLLAAFRVFLRFFVLPGMIFAWVYAGFRFVQAQGKPEAIAKAKSYIWIVVIATVVLFVFDGFLTALQGTINQIVPGSAVKQSAQVGSGCPLADGTYGQVGSDGQCYPSSRGGASQTSPVDVNPQLRH